MGANEPVTKDVEFIESFGRWIGELFEYLGEFSGEFLRRSSARATPVSSTATPPPSSASMRSSRASRS